MAEGEWASGELQLVQAQLPFLLEVSADLLTLSTGLTIFAGEIQSFRLNLSTFFKGKTIFITYNTPGIVYYEYCWLFDELLMLLFSK